jgi:hypothetical protein
MYSKLYEDKEVDVYLVECSVDFQSRIVRVVLAYFCFAGNPIKLIR